MASSASRIGTPGGSPSSARIASKSCIARVSVPSMSNSQWRRRARSGTSVRGGWHRGREVPVIGGERDSAGGSGAECRIYWSASGDGGVGMDGKEDVRVERRRTSRLVVPTGLWLALAAGTPIAETSAPDDPGAATPARRKRRGAGVGRAASDDAPAPGPSRGRHDPARGARGHGAGAVGAALLLRDLSRLHGVRRHDVPLAVGGGDRSVPDDAAGRNRSERARQTRRSKPARDPSTRRPATARTAAGGLSQERARPTLSTPSGHAALLAGRGDRRGDRLGAPSAGTGRVGRAGRLARSAALQPDERPSRNAARARCASSPERMSARRCATSRRSPSSTGRPATSAISRLPAACAFGPPASSESTRSVTR